MSQQSDRFKIITDTGLRNLGNSCYCASIVQILLRLNIDYENISNAFITNSIIDELNRLGKQVIVDDYKSNLAYIKKLNDLILRFNTHIWRDLWIHFKSAIYLNSSNMSQQDSSELLLGVLNKFLYPKIIYTDSKYDSYYNILFIHISDLHPYIPKTLVEQYKENKQNFYYDNNYVGKNIKFQLIKFYQCKKCNTITNRIQEQELNININQYNIQLLTNGVIKSVVEKKCDNCHDIEMISHKEYLKLQTENPHFLNCYSSNKFKTIYKDFFTDFTVPIDDTNYKDIRFIRHNFEQCVTILRKYSDYDIILVRNYIQEQIIDTIKALNPTSNNNSLLNNYSKGIRINKNINKEFKNKHKQYNLRFFYRVIKKYIQDQKLIKSDKQEHIESTYFFTVPNLLLLFSNRVIQNTNPLYTGIFNQPKLKKNISILLPIFDENCNIIRYNTIKYNCKIINIGPTTLLKINQQFDYNEHTNDSINKIIQLYISRKINYNTLKDRLKQIKIKHTEGVIFNDFDENIFSKKMDEIFLLIDKQLETTPLDEREQICSLLYHYFENTQIFPFNVVRYVHNEGHYLTLIRNDINKDNDENEKNIRWTEYNDHSIEQNRELLYNSSYYDNVRIYIYEISNH